MQLSYAYDEIMAEAPYASRLRRGTVLFHGGLDTRGRYVPPRSRNRLAAIEAWTERLRVAGHQTWVVTMKQVERPFFPSVAQSKCLLRHRACDAMTRILTLIGITEGFGNDGIKIMPRLNLEQFFKESIAETCLAHLHQGLFEAHGNDEAGRGDEAGHDVMWFQIRDAALENPRITPDMFENLPIAPPPGYSGPAKPGPEALSVGDLVERALPTLDPMLELLLSALAQILVIELMAYSTFRWAQEVLADPGCSAASDFAPQMVDYIQADENIHVSYLQCALAEVRARTVIDQEGRELPGAHVVDTICERIVRRNTGSRWERMMAYRMGQIRKEMAARPDGERILSGFAALGPIPQATGA